MLHRPATVCCPQNSSKPIKLKYSGVTHMPPTKVLKISTAQDKQAAKRSLDKSLIMKVSARVCCNEKGTPSQKDDGFVITGASGPNIIYMCNPGNASIQRYWCGLLNLQYVRAIRPRLGSPTTPLTPSTRIVRIPGHDNCLLR